MSTSTDPEFDLSGRRAVVTGASAGIGAAIAARFAGAGADVVAVSRRGTAPDRPDGSGSITPVAADLSSSVDLDGLVERAVGLLGGLDILVNNAARGDWRGLDDVDRTYFDELLALNLWAPLRLCQLARPHLAAAAGAVVMIGSVDAVRPSAGGAVYGASKAALGALTVALAKELGADGITVTQVDPGLVDTTMAAVTIDGLASTGFDANLVRRAGRPEEIAGLVHYLVAPAGRFVTGASFRIDGGALALGPFDTMEQGP